MMYVCVFANVTYTHTHIYIYTNFKAINNELDAKKVLKTHLFIKIFCLLYRSKQIYIIYVYIYVYTCI